MPSLIISLMDGSHFTQLQTCSPNISMISAGLVAGVMRLPVRFMYTSHLGGFILPSTPFKASSNLPFADAMREVWKPPDVLSNLACKQPSVFCAFAMSFSMELCVPAQEKPLGKSSFAIWQTSFGPETQSLQSLSNTSFSRPATESMLCGDISAASCMTSPRSFTIVRHVSKSQTPATVRAVYSPNERPATAWQRSMRSGLDSFSFSMAARPPTYIAGWQKDVFSSLDSGPFKHNSNRS
mmetsp:Transcript_3444/g.8008  ORF Transcript_3444/g.8008 Transcript_3444/m.8008 type:complete len:239 (-) Transcript_3444:732-1448(-)